MRRGIWQTATAGLAIGCLTLGAAAQFDADVDEQEEGLDQEPQQVEQEQEHGQDPFGQEADREGELRIGTVDLQAVSEAYERHQQERDAGRQDEWGADAGQEGQQDDLQDPAQAEDPLADDQFGQEERGGIDQEMIDTVREKAREVADEEGVQMIVLEVLHGEDAGVETVDLTDRVIERLERGDEAGAEELMGIGADEETDDLDAEQDDQDDMAW